MKPLVSVIIPTVPSREDVLERAVQSVKSQTYKNIQLVIISDDTVPATEARNKGVKKTNGEYIAFLDDDDVWEPTKIEKQVAFLNDHPSVGLVGCWIYDKRFTESYVDKYPEFNIGTVSLLKWMRFSSTSSYMLRRTLFDKVKGFDVSLPSAQEYDLAIRCSYYMGLGCVQESLVTQYKSFNQITRNATKKVKGLKKIYEKHCKNMGVPVLVLIKFKLAILLYSLSPLFGSKLDFMVVRYKKLLKGGTC